jgi:3-deoxy-manno-octulosonate cytidylyltransferase (CMP-KDO synthetase)
MSVIVIPARYASTRLPGKPLMKIDDLPMIHRVANQCLKTKADRIVIVTDHVDILEYCEKIDGVEVTMSDPEIKSGTDRVAKVMRFIQDDIVINVQGDEPFIEPSVIDNMIIDLENNKQVVMNTSCVEIDYEEAKDSNVVKVVIDNNSYALYFSRALIPYNRDNVSNVTYLKHIGVYGFRRDFLLKYTEIEQTSLENIEKLEQLRALETGVKIKVLKTDYNSVSIDTKEDLEIAEKIAKGEING